MLSLQSHIRNTHILFKVLQVLFFIDISIKIAIIILKFSHQNYDQEFRQQLYNFMHFFP